MSIQRFYKYVCIYIICIHTQCIKSIMFYKRSPSASHECNKNLWNSRFMYFTYRLHLNHWLLVKSANLLCSLKDINLQTSGSDFVYVEIYIAFSFALCYNIVNNVDIMIPYVLAMVIKTNNNADNRKPRALTILGFRRLWVCRTLKRNKMEYVYGSFKI